MYTYYSEYYKTLSYVRSIGDKNLHNFFLKNRQLFSLASLTLQNLKSFNKRRNQPTKILHKAAVYVGGDFLHVEAFPSVVGASSHCEIEFKVTHP